MTAPHSGESYPDPQVEQLLAATLSQVRTAIGQELAETLLPEQVALLGIRTELFQSSTLVAGRDAMPGHYPAADRNLIILTLQGDQQVFLVGGKINPADRFEFGSALGGGIDPRDIHRTAYAYDGDRTITEYAPDDSINRYTGEYGDPEMLLSHIRHSLGECVAIETAGVDPSV